MFDDIIQFHEKFALTYDGPPRALPDDLLSFRYQFMHEELSEYDSASAVDVIQEEGVGPAADLAKQLDALVDLVYVALGTAYLHGFDFDEAWRRVHEANMKKVRAAPDGSNSARKSSHDVVKPPGWTPPDLSDLVEPQAMDSSHD
jgi:predicted HAD superfamily Cof-like phosphohydrolase